MERNTERTGVAPASIEYVDFDQVPVGKLPKGWMTGVTGRGTPKWSVEADPSAPSKPNVLKQSGSGTFAWRVNTMLAIADGFVDVKFKSISGKEDQAGVWTKADSVTAFDDFRCGAASS